jgi:raffinose/stachyose/melibiose transport system permease protein
MEIKKRLSASMTYFISLMTVIAFLGPVSIMMLNSLKSKEEISVNPLGFPETMRWDNYEIAWQRAGLLNNLFNSVTVTVGTVLLIILTGALASYALARLKIGRISGAIFALFILGIILPTFSGLIPLFKLMQLFGLYDTLLGLMLIYAAAGLPITILIITKFFQSVPYELEEAAKIDGLGYLRTFWSIMLPLALPAIVTTIIINSLSVWNDFFTVLVFTSDPSNYTLTRGLVAFKSEFTVDWSLLFAASTMIALPVFLLFLFLQRFLIDGLTSGAIKG